MNEVNRSRFNVDNVKVHRLATPSRCGLGHGYGEGAWSSGFFPQFIHHGEWSVITFKHLGVSYRVENAV